MIVIYKITNPKNRVYIGQTKHLMARKQTYIKNKCKTQRRIYNSIKKYGWENHKFEVMYELPIDVSQDVINNYEIFYWKQYKDCGFDMLNIREPGSNGSLSIETKIKIGEKSKGNKYTLGFKHSELTKQKMSDSRVGEKNPMYNKKHSEKTKKLFSIQRTGVNNHTYGKPSKRRKKILDFQTNKIYDSITETAIYFKVTRKTVRDWIKKGYRFVYL